MVSEKSIQCHNSRHTVVILLFLCLFISACQSPIVPVRNYTYVVSFLCDGKEYTLKTKYKCHYEDLDWLSERGADWHRRRESTPLIITKILDDNIKIEIQPILRPSNICCPSTVDVNSILFIQDQNNPDWLHGFDQVRSKSELHDIRITSSKLEFEGTGYGIFKEEGNQRHPTLQFKSYYTISAETITGSEITSLGLRDYVNLRKSIWLMKGKEYPFIHWGNEDVGAYIKYGKLLRPHIGQVIIAGEKTDNGWVIGKENRTKASQWYVFPFQLRKGEGISVREEDMPRQWVTYNKTRIQIPLNDSLRLHFYDPVNDEIVLFQICRADITSNL